MSNFIQYDDQNFSTAKELRAYLKLQATINGESISEQELEHQVTVIIESQLDEVLNVETSLDEVSFETLEEDSDYVSDFDDYDSEQELSF